MLLFEKISKYINNFKATDASSELGEKLDKVSNFDLNEFFEFEITEYSEKRDTYTEIDQKIVIKEENKVNQIISIDQGHSIILKLATKNISKIDFTVTELKLLFHDEIYREHITFSQIISEQKTSTTSSISEYLIKIDTKDIKYDRCLILNEIRFVLKSGIIGVLDIKEEDLLKINISIRKQRVSSFVVKPQLEHGYYFNTEYAIMVNFMNMEEIDLERNTVVIKFNNNSEASHYNGFRLSGNYDMLKPHASNIKINKDFVNSQLNYNTDTYASQIMINTTNQTLTINSFDSNSEKLRTSNLSFKVYFFIENTNYNISESHMLNIVIGIIPKTSKNPISPKLPIHELNLPHNEPFYIFYKTKHSIELSHFFSVSQKIKWLENKDINAKHARFLIQSNIKLVNTLEQANIMKNDKDISTNTNFNSYSLINSNSINLVSFLDVDNEVVNKSRGSQESSEIILDIKPLVNFLFSTKDNSILYRFYFSLYSLSSQLQLLTNKHYLFKLKPNICSSSKFKDGFLKYEEIKLDIYYKKLNPGKSLIMLNLSLGYNWISIGKSILIDVIQKQDGYKKLSLILIPLVDGYIKFPELEVWECSLDVKRESGALDKIIRDKGEGYIEENKEVKEIIENVNYFVETRENNIANFIKVDKSKIEMLDREIVKIYPVESCQIKISVS